MSKDKALTLALEALNRGESQLRWAAITAIKEALEQPEQEEAKLADDEDMAIYKSIADGYTAKFLAQPKQKPEVCCGAYATCMKPCTPRGRWLAEQEPVIDCPFCLHSFRLRDVYTTPPKRTWVELTDEERAECWSSSAKQSAINIEAKLKEKNT